MHAPHVHVGLVHVVLPQRPLQQLQMQNYLAMGPGLVDSEAVYGCCSSNVPCGGFRSLTTWIAAGSASVAAGSRAPPARSTASQYATLSGFEFVDVREAPLLGLRRGGPALQAAAAVGARPPPALVSAAACRN